MKNNFHFKIYAKSEERLNDWQGTDYKKLKFTNNIDEWLSQPYRIIIVDAFCDTVAETHAFDPMFVNFDWSQCDLVIIKEIFWAPYTDIYEKFILKNKIKNFIISSYNATVKNNLFDPYWMFRPVNYSKIQQVNYISKKYLFDALLGYPREHRIFILGNLLKNKKLLSQSVVTLRNEFLFEEENINEIFENFDPRIKELALGVTYPYISPTMDLSWENVNGNFFNRRYFLDGTDIPWGVYDNTWFSVCTETGSADGEPRLTEKTAKMFLANRVFVMFGNKGTLKLLHELGFKTFDSILDESYDLEVDNVIRYEKAFNQVERLAELDPIEIYRITQDIRNHNFERLYTLRDEFRNRNNQALLNLIPTEFCS